MGQRLATCVCSQTGLAAWTRVSSHLTHSCTAPGLCGPLALLSLVSAILLLLLPREVPSRWCGEAAAQTPSVGVSSPTQGRMRGAQGEGRVQFSSPSRAWLWFLTICVMLGEMNCWCVCKRVGARCVCPCECVCMN